MASQRVCHTLVWVQDLRKNGPINSSFNGNTTHKPQHHVNHILRDIMQTSICYSQNQPSTEIKRRFIVQQNELWIDFSSIQPVKVISCLTRMQSGLGSVVGIATAYGLDGPRIESRWRRDFPHLSRPALRPTQPPVQWVPGLSRG
jgi:hypothetical protein